MSKHKHQCPKCQHIWEHDDTCFDQKDAHTCEKCGTEQYYKLLDETTHGACNMPPTPERFSQNFVRALMEILLIDETLSILEELDAKVKQKQNEKAPQINPNN